MIDVSDGLAADVRHLARASGVGFALDAVPVAEGASLAEALGGGEDYELVFSSGDPAAVMASFAASGLCPPLPIGECRADPAVQLLAGGPLPLVGWEHDWS
jgi:thiamine-monophosphate kinase